MLVNWGIVAFVRAIMILGRDIAHRRGPITYRQLTLFLICCLLIGGILFIVGVASRGPTDDSKTPVATDPSTRSLTAEDEVRVAGLERHTDQWNRTAAPLIRDYLDPGVSAEAWLETSAIQIAELRAIHARLQADIVLISNPPVRTIMMEFADNYMMKLYWIGALRKAVASGDVSSETTAQNSLTETAQHGQELALAFLDKIRPYVDPETLRRMAQKKQKEINELMTPR